MVRHRIQRRRECIVAHRGCGVASPIEESGRVVIGHIAAVAAMVCHIRQNRNSLNDQNLRDGLNVLRDDLLLNRQDDRLRIA